MEDAGYRHLSSIPLPEKNPFLLAMETTKRDKDIKKRRKDKNPDLELHFLDPSEPTPILTAKRASSYDISVETTSDEKEVRTITANL